ncbi:MAG: Gfo/Idh/MocA family oxidoreductase [Planctomycetota bacterium]|nr:Gfo/Idh/MocA family oxidoreductase [Planctomycetota bacterium]
MKRDTKHVKAQPASRREFLKTSGAAAAGSALAAMALPRAYADENNTIRLALIGCGGRGSGAAVNAFESPYGPVKLVAMADLFENRLAGAHKSLSAKFADKMDVPADRQFVGFDAYKKAIDCLKPGDVAMLTGYAGFRPQQLEYAVEKGINVFMEKSFATDPPGVRRVIKAGEAAEKKNVKIAAGLMCRHSRNRQELIKRLRDGQLGDIQLIRAFRMQPCGPMGQRPPQEKELNWQIRNFTCFLWVAGGLFAEMDIHQIDEICWIKDACPVSAHGVGGRAANSTDCSQNLDSLSIEWTFADGTKATDVARWLPNCHTDFSTYIHGTKCAALFGIHHQDPIQIYKDQRIADDNIAWRADAEKMTPWQAEWDVLLDDIRRDRPHNEAKRAALSNLTDIMGRAAVHSGQLIAWDQALASNFQFFAGIDTLTPDSDPPLKADANGRYPVPVPGVWKEI